MKNKNKTVKYFNEKNFSIVKILLIILTVISAFVATFIRGGGPIGLPILLLCIIGFVICNSLKIKDSEVEQALKKIIQDNQIKCSDNTIIGYDFRNTTVKKRKDGKLISPICYITNITLSSSVETVFKIYIIDLISSSVQMVSHSVNDNGDITLTEETVSTNVGHIKVSYIRINSCNYTIPVTLNDYKSSQLIESICNRK